MPDIPVYLVQKENSNNKPRTLHRNMLLSFNSLPCTEVENEPKPRIIRQPPPIAEHPETDEDDSSCDSSDDEAEETFTPQSVPRYVTPARRSEQTRPDSYS